MRYFFESEIAGAVGVDAAVILTYFYDLPRKTEKTKTELLKVFDFYSESQMRRFLRKLYKNSFLRALRNHENISDSRVYYSLSDIALNILNSNNTKTDYQIEGR